MKIGIIVAMAKEYDLVLHLITRRNDVETGGFRISKGVMGSHEVALMQCGIGKVNAALGTLSLIDDFNPDLVINSGVAGGADPSVGVLDILVAKGVAYHDVWCGPGTEYGRAAGCPTVMACSPLVVDTAAEVLASPRVRYGLLCSGDKFISTPEEVEFIKNRFPEALAVDMEAGAIAQVCRRREVPFGVIRVISDTPGAEENISQYEDFWTQAPAETFEALKALIYSMK